MVTNAEGRDIVIAHRMIYSYYFSLSLELVIFKLWQFAAPLVNLYPSRVALFGVYMCINMHSCMALKPCPVFQRMLRLS